MNFFTDANVNKRKYYGGYCSLCKLIQREIKPYVQFSLEDMQEVKKLYRESKRLK